MWQAGWVTLGQGGCAKEEAKEAKEDFDDDWGVWSGRQGGCAKEEAKVASGPFPFTLEGSGTPPSVINTEYDIDEEGEEWEDASGDTEEARTGARQDGKFEDYHGCWGTTTTRGKKEK